MVLLLKVPWCTANGKERKCMTQVMINYIGIYWTLIILFNFPVGINFSSVFQGNKWWLNCYFAKFFVSLLLCDAFKQASASSKFYHLLMPGTMFYYLVCWIWNGVRKRSYNRALYLHAVTLIQVNNPSDLVARSHFCWYIQSYGQ